MFGARPRKESRWSPVPAMLAAGVLLVATGCGLNVTGPDLPKGSDIDASFTEPGDPNRVQVTAVRPRSTPGGCEVDVTFRNVSDKALSAGFRAEILDSAGHVVTSRSTAVQQAPPSETRTVSSEGTTAGPSGVRCPTGGRARVTEVSVYNF
jgi:hypothetical protein